MDGYEATRQIKAQTGGRFVPVIFLTALHGVIETHNSDGEFFGQQRLEALLARHPDATSLFDTLHRSLIAFRGAASQSDDLTLIEITCDPKVTQEQHHAATTWHPVKEPLPWQIAIDLDPHALRADDPLTHVLQMIVEMQGLYEHRGRLHTILTELFSNALEHGVLRLDAALKSSPEGFADYYVQREERLAALDHGWVKIVVEHTPCGTGGALRLHVIDSGAGFDYNPRRPELAHNLTARGRGIPLVRSLCKELVYHGSGSYAHVVYVWS